jgi:membrane protease YdiL (CAAX protease family)
MKQSSVVGFGVAAAMVAWWAAGELHAAARALTAVLIGLLPAFAVLQANAVAQLEVLPSRVKMYASTMIGLWVLALVTALVATQARIDPRLLGVATLPWLSFFVWLAFGLAAVSALVIAFKAFGMAETPMLQHMIPQTGGEKLAYLGVCLTAGICEELIFRGFLIGALRAATGSVGLAVMLAAGAFGIAHAHQDAAGALRATLLGLVLSVPLLVTGSLYPGIAAHVIVDLLGGLWLARWLLRS